MESSGDMSPQRVCCGGLSTPAVTSLRCARPARDEDVQVILVGFQGDGDERSGHPSHYTINLWLPWSNYINHVFLFLLAVKPCFIFEGDSKKVADLCQLKDWRRLTILYIARDKSVISSAD